MEYQAHDFSHLLGLKGFSDALLKNHFTLYQGYVINTNKLHEKLLTLVKEGKASSPEFAELKRRFGWEFNGMRLHEYYFGNMCKEKKQMKEDSSLYQQVLRDFGSGDLCKSDFVATGALRGIGWVIMYYDPLAQRLFNVWVNEHDAGHLSGAVPLLVMDVFEHAFMLDYGLKRADYINNFLDAIDWDVVQERFEKAQ